MSHSKSTAKFLPHMNKGYVDGHIEPTTDFDFDEIDRRLTQSPSAPQEAETVAAAKILHHLVVTGGTNPRETMVWINTFLFVMGLHPNQDQTGERIAQGLKVGKAEWFRRCSKLRHTLSARGFDLPKIAGQWGAEGKQSAANQAVRNWVKRGGLPMVQIHEADKKLRWIAEYMHRLNFDHMPPMAREELKAKLMPVVKIYSKL